MATAVKESGEHRLLTALNSISAGRALDVFQLYSRTSKQIPRSNAAAAIGHRGSLAIAK